MIYRNVRTGREVVRQAPDEWLDRSAGWELLEEPVAEGDNEPSHDGDEEEI